MWLATYYKIRLVANDPTSTGLFHGSANRAIQDHERLEIAMELERMVTAFATNTADAAATKGRGQIAYKEGIDPHQAGAKGPAACWQ